MTDLRFVTERASRALAISGPLLAMALASCIGVDPPEGVLVCTTATAAADCPSGWVCRSNDRCYRTADGVMADAGMDGGDRPDAFEPDEPDAFEAEDAPMGDAPGLDAFAPDSPMATPDAAMDAPGDAGPPPADVFVVPDAYSECDTAADCMEDGNMCTDAACVGHLCTTTPTDCDDGVACTNDGCFPATGCQNNPDSMMCSGGQVCHPTRGCEAAGSCANASECDDGLFCTTDDCVASRCSNVARTCPDDASACTTATCNEMSNACENPFDSSSLTDPTHCGSSGVMCTAPCPTMGPNTVATCTGGVCGVACAPNFHNINGLAADGCEYSCTVTSPTMDPADAAPVDANCDGADGVINNVEYIYVTPTGAGAPSMGGSPANAVNITRAFELATTRAGSGVFVTLLLAQGTYSISRVLDAPNRLTMWGGYDAATFRTRSATVRSLISSTDSRAMNVTGAITVDSVDFETTDRGIAGDYTRTLWIVGSPNAVLRNLTVTAGAGGPGAAGAAGPARTGTAPAGMSGQAGTTTGPGGGGGTAGNPSSGGIGSAYGSLAAPGQAAAVSMSGTCGTGGARGIGAVIACTACDILNFDAGANGGAGLTGCPGTGGGHGAGGSGVGSLNAGGWFPASAASGLDGAPGNSGGGGGGGAGIACMTSGQRASGGGGGQGGQGGQGGAAGGAGGPGGGAFAIAAVGSTLTLVSVAVVTRSGGSGGQGGNGGSAQAGGAGGMGGDGFFNMFPACGSGIFMEGLRGGNGGAGGNGGTGGTGGCGGGGAGGPSIGIFGAGGTTITPGATVTYSVGSGGAAGAACTSSTSGNRGGSGVQMNQLLLP